MTRTATALKISAAQQLLREVGLAAAALALWMLVLLSPLHRASQALTGFREAGVLPASSWTLCQPAKAADGDRPAPECPFQHLGHALGAPPAGLVFALPHAVLVAILGQPSSRVPRAATRRRLRQPRAPPPLAKRPRNRRYGAMPVCKNTRI